MATVKGLGNGFTQMTYTGNGVSKPIILGGYNNVGEHTFTGDMFNSFKMHYVNLLKNIINSKNSTFFIYRLYTKQYIEALGDKGYIRYNSLHIKQDKVLCHMRITQKGRDYLLTQEVMEKL